MSAELVALLGDARVGTLRRDARGTVSFAYDEPWREHPDAYPLSVSMPLAQREHRGDALVAYLWGLLPDNEVILEAWGKRFQVSSRNVFGLLNHVGADCPGAVRFLSPARVESRDEPGETQWLNEPSIAARLRALRDDESAWRAATDTGQFSLGGAQPKTALFFDGTRWGVPAGRTPTTHIFKPGTARLLGHAENEHYCLTLAKELGLPVARSEVLRFEDEVAIVVERYDRIRYAGTIVRVHQEDFCQALGTVPIHKYESDGGPGVRAIATLLRGRSRSANEDLDAFVASLAFNWIIAGTDAHAKNYSLLIGTGGAVRLAPLYDIASFLPYASTGVRKLKLAMKIGGTYRLHEIGVHAWDKLASDLNRNADKQRAMLASMCNTIPDCAAQVLRATTAAGLNHPTLVTLNAKIQKRAQTLARIFE
jgi:serine/threonine-protein kinase HipA